MKHKIGMSLLAVSMATAAALGLAACRKKEPVPPPHEHSYSETWSSDDVSHWHASTCGHADAVSGKAAHDYENGVCGTCNHAHENHTFEGRTCTVCGYELPASALRYEEVLDGDGQKIGYSVVGWDESATDRSNLVIPAEYEGEPVVSVGASAFDIEDGDGDETLTSVYLPETVKDLGKYAFSGCPALKTINLEHVVNVYKGAFYECTGIENAEMGELNTLGQYAFYGCTSLKYVRVEGAEVFEAQAFRKCPALERADFGDGVESIPQFTFSESDGVRAISIGKAFSQASGDLAYDIFPQGLESIEVSAENATYATEGGILYNKAKTEIVYVPKSIKGRVTIADGVTEIEARGTQFMNHVFITSLTVPSSVDSIANGFSKAFKGCYALAEIYNLTAAVEIADLADFGLGEGTAVHTSLSEKSVVTDPDESGFVWRTDTDTLHTYFGKEKNLTLLGGHEGKSYAVGAYAFYGKDLTEAVIGEGAKEIGVSAFSGCTALEKISIPKSMKKICIGAFADCTALERVDYAGTVSEWAAIEFEENIFVNTAKEKQATLYLGDGNPLPEKIKIEGIENVGTCAFYGAPVTEVVLGESVKHVGQDAFSYCSGLKSVVLGKDMEFFYYAFLNGAPVETVYYEGTQETWATLNNGNGGSSALKKATVSYFSADPPTEEQWGKSANWWRYGTDGFAEPWIKE